MAKSDRSEAVNSTTRKGLLETSSMMNDNPSSVGLMNDAGQLDIVREWIFRNYNDLVGHGRVSSHACEDEESSQFSIYHQNKSYRRYTNMEGSSRGSQVGSNHAELLRRLEDLKMEINRIYDLSERTENTVFPEGKTMHNSLPRPFTQPNPAEQHPYRKCHFGQFPYVPGSGANTPDIYSYPGYLPNYPTDYQDQVKPPMQKPSYQFAPKSVLGSSISDRMEFGGDLFVMHPQESFLHPHMCSCFSCSQKYHPQCHSPVHQTTFGISGIAKSPPTSDLYHRADSVPIWPPHDIPSVASTPARLLHSRLLGSWPSDVQSGMDILRRRRSLIVPQGSKKFCHPLAGGAPFMSCPKCSELLRLPQVFKTKRLSMQNLQCGVCFKVFQVDLRNRKRATFIERKFLLAGENGFEEAVNERNESPDIGVIQAEPLYDESYAVEALPVTIGSSNLEFQQEQFQHGDQRENRVLSASMSQRSKSFTSVSSEDPILSNDMLRGRLLQDITKHQNPPEHEELNANTERNSAPSLSSQEQHMANDVIVGRILVQNSQQNNHTENQDLKASTDQNSQSFTASSVSLAEQNLSSNVNVDRILQEEFQQNDQKEHRDQKNPGASEETSADNSFPAPQSVDAFQNLPDSFTEIGQSQSMTETENNEIGTENNENGTLNIGKENTVNEKMVEPDVDFSFISCLSSNEFTEEWLSVDETTQTNVGKWSESSAASFIRKNFKELSRYHQNGDDERTNVTINSHPITKQNLKKAEMLAGRVLPGNYWYDYYGGFWGVLGEHCLGIIPPFIDEFNYPMLANCAAGNTNVFVNGRELHQLDLELLSTRGLPTMRNRSYKIDISGTIYDERTGEELKSLGLLAPSVLKANKGFGMGVPAKYEYSVNHR